MWEIFSYGKTPYAALNNQETKDQVDSGYRLAKPENCPDKIYELIKKCWEKDPVSRPCFKDIYASLDPLYFQLGKKKEEPKYSKQEMDETLYNN